jgi:hypothetical protein
LLDDFFLWQICFEWFSKGISDLESDTQGQLFQKEILKLDLNRLTQTGKKLSLAQSSLCLAFSYTVIHSVGLLRRTVLGFQLLTQKVVYSVCSRVSITYDFD